MAVCTNSYFTSSSTEIAENEPELDIEECFYTNFDWIDDFPETSGFLAIWNTQKNFIDKILRQEIELNHPFFRAARHFHQAQKLETDYSAFPEDTTDISIVLYMSALENAANLCSIRDEVKDKACKECGQQKYSIRQKVKALVKTHVNECIEILIDEYYSIRSKYLHTGSTFSNNSYLGQSIPQLNPDSGTGCWIQYPMFSVNLREFVSYILRSIFLKELNNGKMLL